MAAITVFLGVGGAASRKATDQLNDVHFVNSADQASEAGDLDRAIADYREAIRLNSQNVRAYCGRGNLLGQERRLFQVAR